MRWSVDRGMDEQTETQSDERTNVQTKRREIQTRELTQRLPDIDGHAKTCVDTTVGRTD